MKTVTTVFSALLFALLTACNAPKKDPAKDAPVAAAPTEAPQKTGPDPQSLKELSNFPPALEGFERYVIHLDTKATPEEEEGFRVELIPGKREKVDCNRHALSGSFNEKTLEGWGYTFYEFSSKGDIMSTMMACPDQKLTEKFIAGESKIVRYNPKLPIVVYLPKGFELQYKIWLAQETIDADKG